MGDPQPEARIDCIRIEVVIVFFQDFVFGQLH